MEAKRGTRGSPTDDNTILNITIAVASLKAASTFIMVESLVGTSDLRKTSNTVTVSVGEIIAAKSSETTSESPTSCHRITPQTRVATITPTVARTSEGLTTLRRLSTSTCIIASKISGGT